MPSRTTGKSPRTLSGSSSSVRGRRAAALVVPHAAPMNCRRFRFILVTSIGDEVYRAPTNSVSVALRVHGGTPVADGSHRMKIALQINGKYVVAENGGDDAGIVRANRAAAG